MSNIDRRTQENVANSEESTAAAEQLFATAEHLTDFMSKLQAVIDGKSTASISDFTDQFESETLKRAPRLPKRKREWSLSHSSTDSIF